MNATHHVQTSLDDETLDLIRRLEKLHPERHPEELLRIRGGRRLLVEAYLRSNKERRHEHLQAGFPSPSGG